MRGLGFLWSGGGSKSKVLGTGLRDIRSPNQYIIISGALREEEEVSDKSTNLSKQIIRD